jgi:hypothetical protein
VNSRLAAIVAVVLAAALTACQSTTHGVDNIVRIVDDTHLVAFAQCPKGPITSRVRQLPDSIRILLTFKTNGDAKCAGSVAVALDAPLGRRVIVDDQDGSPMLVGEDYRCGSAPPWSRCDGVSAAPAPGSGP